MARRSDIYILALRIRITSRKKHRHDYCALTDNAIIKKVRITSENDAMEIKPTQVGNKAALDFVQPGLKGILEASPATTWRRGLVIGESFAVVAA